MSKPIRCDECGEKTVTPTVLETYSTNLDHDGRTYRVEVHDLAVYQCTACGEVDMDTEAAGRLYDAFRDAVGVMPAAEIRRRRKELGLKQEDMAALLGIAGSTLSRWETGAQMQQRCMDVMLRAFFEVPALREFLARRAGREDLAPAADVDHVITGPVLGHGSDEVRWLNSPPSSEPGSLPAGSPLVNQEPPYSDLWRQMDSGTKGGGWNVKTPSLTLPSAKKLVA